MLATTTREAGVPFRPRARMIDRCHNTTLACQNDLQIFQKTELACNIGSALLVATGTIVGGVTLNPIPLGVISGTGLLLKTYSETKNFKKKIEMSKFAYTSYEKVLTHLRSFMRGLEYNDKEFLDFIKILDDIIIDMCPLTDKFEKKYNKVFIQQ